MGISEYITAEKLWSSSFNYSQELIRNVSGHEVKWDRKNDEISNTAYSPASLFATAAAFSKSGIFFIFKGLVGGFLPAAFKKCAKISVCDSRY